MGAAVFGTFIPVYLHNTGFSQPQIGVLLGLGPFIAMLGQPIWGSMADRSKKKNDVLKILILGSALTALLFPISDQYLYCLILISVITFFQSSIPAISDAITLEELDKQTKWSFGMIRMGGTIGFAIMSVGFGTLARENTDSMFAVYAIIMAIAFLLVLRMPSVAGYPRGERKTRIWVLFRNKKLLMYLGLSFVIQATLGYYYTFFAIHLQEMGGSNALIGWSMVISSLSEIPFLLFANKLLKRVKIHYILIGAALASSARWFLFYKISSPYWTLPVQGLHGLTFIVLSVTMAIYINKEMPAEWKASGQTLYGLISLVGARIIGSLLGGFVSGIIGVKLVFLYNSILSLAAVIVFGLCVYEWKRIRIFKSSP